MRHRIRIFAPFLAALLLALTLVDPVAYAQTQGGALPAAQAGAANPDASGPPPRALGPGEIDDLISAIETPDARERFIARLRTLRAAAAPPPEETTPDRFGGRVVALLSDRIERISGGLVSGATMVLDAPRLVHWFRGQMADPRQQELWLRVLWKVLIVLMSGLVAEWLVRRLLLRPRRAIEGEPRDGFWVRLPFLLARTVLDVVPIAAFAAAAYAVLPLLEPSQVTRLVTISLVNASVASRAILAIARLFFVPRAAHLRLVAIDDETANYIVVWIRRVTDLAVYGYFLAEAALLLGMPKEGYVALTKAIGLLLALLLVVFVLQNRSTVGNWIRGPERASMPGMTVVRRRLADVWHVLAVVYLAAVYLVWALEIEGGFEFVFRATALSIVILVAAKLLVLASRNAVDRGFGLRSEMIEQYPGLGACANRYFAVLHVFITVAIVVLAAFAILEAWGIGSFQWLSTPAGARIAGSVVTSAFVIAVAVVFSEMISSMIERYLSRGEKGELAISARAKTLLPLLRKALVIVVSTIVGFIVLSEIGVNIGPLLAGAGVVGLAVGFGSQTLVKDVITGIFILAEDQFAVGDVVRVSDKAGVVEDITIRTIRLRDLSGNVHIIPFSSVTTVENMTKDYSRYVFDIGVAYREDVDGVIEVLKALGAELQEDGEFGQLILEPLEILGLDKFGDSAVMIRARFTTKPTKQWQVGREFNRRMKRKFDELGIEIPFPHQTIYFGEAKGGGAPPAYVRIGAGDGDPASAPKAEG